VFAGTDGGTGGFLVFKDMDRMCAYENEKIEEQE